ncbi:choice-of-anchor N protein [Crocosphaera sp. UHCC 0190]|uniref:choice-of-anchor N protein n=1 Tax=Crocosphaera sp. UHCC 0190 TaxID=3110246 RepID=UPI002B1FF6D7|nr:choice-of-anchor N protein [Crocosphaera sp. UHCC 0190]MEA5509033.1 choice-of-anchor N protein [Crocosphaera sp. UHCC 0190]
MNKLFSTLVAASQPLSSVLATGAALTASLLASSLFSPAFAIPNLQLNVTGGTYLSGDESGTNVDGSGGTINPFTLNLLCQTANGNNANRNICPTNNYFFSIALLDAGMNSLTNGFDFTNIGSFSVKNLATNLTTIYTPNSTDFSFGHPGTSASGALQPHGVFDTWYKEVSIGNFATSPKTLSVDAVNANAGFDPTAGTQCPPNSGCDMFYQQFEIDIANLSNQVKLHFDFYNKNANGSVKQNAPFSHDVVSTVGGGGNPPDEIPPDNVRDVPEPSSLLGLIAFGTLIAGSSLKRR